MALDTVPQCHPLKTGQRAVAHNVASFLLSLSVRTSAPPSSTTSTSLSGKAVVHNQLVCQNDSIIIYLNAGAKIGNTDNPHLFDIRCKYFNARNLINKLYYLLNLIKEFVRNSFNIICVTKTWLNNDI